MTKRTTNLNGSAKAKGSYDEGEDRIALDLAAAGMPIIPVKVFPGPRGQSEYRLKPEVLE
jgi:hypothetical protein